MTEIFDLGTVHSLAHSLMSVSAGAIVVALLASYCSLVSSTVRKRTPIRVRAVSPRQESVRPPQR